MPKSIVKAKEYKVQQGDTLKSIADTAGITWQELAKFNFGSDDPGQINKFLRNNVGCYKRDDGHNFVITGKEDPGIIYLPQDVPPKSFAASSTNTLTVKQVTKKKFIGAKVMVQFRPLSGWKGEFGFDWLRIKNDVLIAEKAYGDIITGGYNGTNAGYTPAEAFEKLKGEYETIPTQVKAKNYYFVPWLNLYPKTASGNPTPPSQAELRISIIVEDEEPLSIDFDYNKDLFQLSIDTLADKAVGAQRQASDKTVKITCLDEFDTDMEIKVIAYPKTWKLEDPIPLAGKIKIPANSRYNRRHIKFVFVKVLTDMLDTGSASTGAYGNTEVKNMTNALYQALFYGEIENGPDLDLTTNADYKKGGKFVDAANKYKWSDAGFRPGLRTMYLAVKDGDGVLVNAKYDDSKVFTVFAFNEPAVGSVIGAIEGIGIRNLVLFANRDETTVNHEVLHGLGLRHTHKESNAGYKVLAESKYTYPYALTAGNADLATDNVMSYNSNGLTTWHWQWQLLKDKNP